MIFWISSWPLKMQSRMTSSRQLVSCRLDHNDRLGGADDDQVELGQVALAVGRVEDDLVVDQSDPDGAQQVVEGDRRHRERGRRGVERQHVGVVLAVG